MKERNLKIRNNVKGITLIALVITIIVLLILAGVSIAMLTGENGILTQAKKAKADTENAAKEEEKMLSEIESEMTGEAPKVFDETPGILDGEGTEEEPFKIESVEDLVTFINTINDGDDFGEQVIELVYTLDITSTNSYVDSNTTAFGDYNGDSTTKGLYDEINDKNYTGLILADNTFSGTLKGNGKEIRNIYSNVNNQEGNIGLVGSCQGNVENLKVSGEYKATNVQNYYRIGGIAGRASGNIVNCESSVIITADITDEHQDRTEKSLYIGGIVGKTEETGVVNNCKNNGNINVKLSVDYALEERYRLDRLGGIVGTNDGRIINSVNYGIINLEHINLDRTYNNNRGGISVGGIAGTNTTDSSVSEIINVINYGNITAICDEDIKIGGITGNNEEGTPTIKNAYNKGNIVGESKYEELNIGGIVGIAGDCTLDRLYNTGKITANKETKYIGGIIGDIYGTVTVTNSKYLSSTASGAVEGGELSGVERVDSLTPVEIKELLNEGVEVLNTGDLIAWKSV